ncbi:hypothetical protein, variant [Verruconis gallopava]|uniref:Transcriptional regulatory protein DEP1 n=1 Tax=Verruconis gallopava TaxID=253628 RepID=A0A0D2ALV9_9PEZI|nr:hypothetical protein, variant [Verruconis gallopava]KIW07758.1 hypothetical protein, variant [Verruconis gallopava]
MLASRSRSRSRTADTAPSRGTDVSANPNSDSRLSPAPSSTSPTPSPTLPDSKDHKPHDMISTVTRQSPATPLAIPAQSENTTFQQRIDNQDDDDRSSSLSELEDVADDQLDTASAHLVDQESEYDTEAETERLERTPQKLNAPLNNNSLPEKSPSKLAQEILADDSSTPTAVSNDAILADQQIGSPANGDFDTNGIELDHSETPSRKRKRSESAVSSLSDTDEPLAKRSHSQRYKDASAMSSTETLVNKPPPSADHDDESGDQDPEAAVTTEKDAEAETQEPVAPPRGRKGRKGKRKGRRAAGDDVDVNGDEQVVQEEPEPVEEEEEDSNRDEEIARKRLALEAFSKIEKDFASFRERHINQQLQQISQELDLLRLPSSSHPEFLAQLRCIDHYRDEKIRHQNVLFKFKHDALQVRTVCERQQLHSQYFQEVRNTRERTLEECYRNLYAIQKDRRRWGADDANYAHMYQPKRAQQIAQQTSYNLEVSILSGIAKHVGFPAAPELSTLPPDDVDSDFKLMKIPDRPLHPRISLRDTEREAIDRTFYEQNPWANPPLAPTMMQAQAFATPGGPNRIVSNGSTIDVNVLSAPTSQNPTPQNRDLEGGHMAKLPHQVDSSPLASSGGTIPSVLSATTFSTSALHGVDGKDTPTVPPPALSISVGGGNRLVQ